MYCEGCEEFKIGGICMEHLGQPLKKIEEEHWFFALSKYRDFLAEFHKKNPGFIQPESRRAEIINQIATLEDVCVTRYMDWGIPFPLGESYKVYVWFDALLNYITGADTYWNTPPDLCTPIHVIGKDIVRFHTLLWPAMLHAGEFPQPQGVFVHGFVLRDGKKESKSSGTSITPISLIQEYGADAVRYYFMSKCNFHGDGDYNEKHIKEIYNGELANNLGNLLSRVVSMIQKYFPDGLPAPSPEEDREWASWGLLARSSFIDEKWYNRFCLEMGSFNYVPAIHNVWELLSQGNTIIEKAEPWNLYKEGKMHFLAGVLRDEVILLRIVALCISPVMPTTAEKIYMTFRYHEDDGDEVNYWEAVNKLSFLRLVSRNNGFMLGGVRIRPEALVDGKLPCLFPRK
jgi:methionyl-tRNA synthetase